VTGRRGRRCKKLLDDFKEKRGYCKLKEKAPDRTVWRRHFGTGYGTVVRQTKNDDDKERRPLYSTMTVKYSNYQRV
jgi:hypothetical protein